MTNDKLDAIIALLDDHDKVPDENGWYTISFTTYGNSSLALGGTYYDQANNYRLTAMLKGRNGFHELASWPGVYSLSFDPAVMDDETAEMLISALQDMHLNGNYPCLDEDLANSLEWDDKTEAVKEALNDMEYDEDLSLPDG